MFREMRRANQQLSREENIRILQGSSSGVLALYGDSGYPYAVPLSFAYSGGRLYFHSATTGHKLDAVSRCAKASFCVVAQDQVVPEKYTTCFISVIAFGVVRRLDGDDEKRAALELLAAKYSPGMRPDCLDALDRVAVLELSIEHMTGKEGSEQAARGSRPPEAAVWRSVT